MVEIEQVKATYRKWYNKDKEAFNARRRERYAQNAGYRAKCVNSTRASRAKSGTHKPEGALIRIIGTIEIKVFRISAVSARIGRSVQMIRAWERKGMIPGPSFGRGHRVYTNNQVNLMKKIVQVAEKYRNDRELLQEHLLQVKEFVHGKWEEGL